MKKIIEGKRFDTETAKVVHSDLFGYQSDFHYCWETLYITKGGSFFLHGEGGALSKYGRRVESNAFASGEQIFPMTPAEAKKWLEDHDGVKALERYFADSIVDA